MQQTVGVNYIKLLYKKRYISVVPSRNHETKALPRDGLSCLVGTMQPLVEIKSLSHLHTVQPKKIYIYIIITSPPGEVVLSGEEILRTNVY